MSGLSGVHDAMVVTFMRYFPKAVCFQQRKTLAALKESISRAMYVKSHFDSFDLHYPPDPLFENSLPNYFSNYLKSLKISHVPFMRDNDIIFKPKK